MTPLLAGAAVAAAAAPVRLRFRNILGGEMMPMRALAFALAFLFFGLNILLNGDVGVPLRLNLGD